MVYANDDGNNGDSNGNGNDATAATDGNNVDDNDSGDLRTAIGCRQFDNNNGTTMMQVDNDGNEGDGRDGDSNSDGDGDGDGNGDDAATAINGNDVYEDGSGNLRMMIGQR